MQNKPESTAPAANPDRPVQGLSVYAEDLEVIFGQGSRSVHALNKVSLEVPAGQFLVIRGRSGSGKSTLFQTLAGIRSPTRGRVVIGDTEIDSLPEKASARFRRQHIGLVYQFFNLVPVLNVVENIALPLMIDGQRLSTALPRVHALMDRLGIPKRSGQMVSDLSGGEMQRVAIARALIHEPGLVLADEPTGNLDEANGALVLSMLTQLCRERRLTVVMMTHDPSATDHCDRMVRLLDGKIESDLAPFDE
ncbi:MAG TPA: ABC transporter ATP-binding protein [Myxococcota bacterium]|nr:ABC transporter ATP-binding protein [Myxococcota bacterium]